MVCLASVRSSDNHLMIISKETPQPSITKISFKITYLKFDWNLPGDNELTSTQNVGFIYSKGPQLNFLFIPPMPSYFTSITFMQDMLGGVVIRSAKLYENCVAQENHTSPMNVVDMGKVVMAMCWTFWTCHNNKFSGCCRQQLHKQNYCGPVGLYMNMIIFCFSKISVWLTHIKSHWLWN